MELWEKGKRKNAQEIIDWLLSVVTESGIYPHSFKNTVAFTELGSSSTKYLSDFQIIRIINAMRSNSKKTIDDFERIYSEISRTDSKKDNGPLDIWFFLIPVKINLNSDIIDHPRIKILNKYFTFLPAKSALNKLNAEGRKTILNPNLIRINTGIKDDQIPSLFISVCDSGKDEYDAWDRITPAFDALRGIIELSLGFFVTQIMWGEKSARRKIPHPVWMVTYKKSSPLKWLTFETEENRSSRIYELDNKNLSRIKKNGKLLIKEPNQKSTLSLIADCLRLYSQAMDANFNHLCFLGFWQLAEAITRSQSAGGRTDKVVARLAWHGHKFDFVGSGFQNSLLYLAEKRNDIVHRGIHDIDDDDINILKVACESALDWLFTVQKSLPTINHIDTYYGLREKSDTDCRTVSDCITYINNLKKKKQYH
jgi:hypothetical protein